VTDAGTLREVADRGGEWRDGTESVAGIAESRQLAALADLLGGPPPGGTVPPMWTAVLTPTWPSQRALGDDGHPRTAVGLPPLPERRRLFAGGRLRQHGPLHVGAPVTRTTSVRDVQVKEGRNGTLMFVTVEHVTVTDDGRTVATEEHDVVYRSGPAARTASAAVDAAATAPAELSLSPDAITLFRFSALTGNSHRIHYDEAYATAVEGLPGRLVHGPLVALLMLELPRRLAPDHAVVAVDYRLTSPVVAGATVTVDHVVDGDGRWVVRAHADGRACASGTVLLAEGATWYG